MEISQLNHVVIERLFKGRQRVIHHRLADLYGMIFASFERQTSMRADIDNEENEIIRHLLEAQLERVIWQREGWMRESEELQRELKELEQIER
ncbi:hypothetical protein F5Y06DRAFT_280797 [Hypoxylon sp. FL0890]|nr:hypothetical protein F5Y06DRAFT_280797 [Hypoxylon sp. FL0890]